MNRLLFLLPLVLFVLVSCSKEEEAPTPPPTPTYKLSFSAEEGGTVSTEGGTYNQGSKITVTATPDGQYLFKEWSDGSTVNPREITVNADLTLKATFVKKTYPLIVTIEGEGTVAEEVIIQGSTTETTYNAGTTVRLTATPNEGWVFAGWSGDVESEERVIEVPIEKGTSVSASFFKGIELSVKIIGKGTLQVDDQIISNDSVFFVKPGLHELIATPSENYEFIHFSGDQVYMDYAGQNQKTFEILGNKLVNVVFGPEPVGIFVSDTHTIVSSPLKINSIYTSDLDIQNSLGFGMGFGLNDLNGNFNLIINAGNYQTLEGQVTFHLEKNNATNQWSIINQYYPDPSFGQLRDYDEVNEDVYAFADHGQEYFDGKPWPYGYVWVGKNMRSESIQWQQVSNQKSFYHSVAQGDIDNDNDFDIISNHYGTYGDWKKEPPYFNIHSWLQNSDGSFTENRNIFSESAKSMSLEATAVEIVDLDNDGINEIVSGVSGVGLQVYKKENTLFELQNIYTDGIFSKDVSSLTKEAPPGPTTIESADVDGDGDTDLIVIGEGYDFLQIWNNDGEGGMSAGQLLFEGYDIITREFELIDVDNDGDLDITLNPFNFYTMMMPKLAEKDDSGVNGYININELIFFNNNGVFTKSPKTIKVHVRNLGGIPKLKGSLDNGVFKFWYIQAVDQNDSEDFSDGSYVIINELIPDFSEW